MLCGQVLDSYSDVKIGEESPNTQLDFDRASVAGNARHPQG